MGYPEKVKNEKIGNGEIVGITLSAMGLLCVLTWAINDGVVLAYFISVLIAAGMVAIWFLPKYLSSKKSKVILSQLSREEKLERLRMIEYILAYEKHEEGLRRAKFKLEGTEYEALVAQYEVLKKEETDYKEAEAKRMEMKEEAKRDRAAELRGKGGRIGVKEKAELDRLREQGY